MKKWIIVAAVIVITLITATYLYINQPHRSVYSEVAIETDAETLFHAFEQNETAANLKFLNKVVRVRGKINSIERNTDGKTILVLHVGDGMFGINCTLLSEHDLKAGEEIVIKGICTGYLSDVVLTQCLIE
jgi:hypothetical protein